MPFRIVEQLCVAKSGDDAFNEDGIVVTDDVVAVFDGATDQRNGQATPESPTPGRAATQALLAEVERLDGCSDPQLLVERLHAAIATLDDAVGEPVAVGALFVGRAGLVVRVGDIAVGLDGTFDTPRKQVDEIAATARAAFLNARIAAGEAVDELRADDPGRAMILPLLIEQRQWRNSSSSRFGFGAIDGTRTPRCFIDVLPVRPGSEVVLATDGYRDPQCDLASSERLLAEANAADPLHLGPPPGTKAILPGNESFDDRAYVRIST